LSLQIENLSKTFISKHKQTSTLQDINFEFRKGEFISILGPSGCGKSTLINIIAGLEKASNGKVIFNKNEITCPGPDRIIMFQESALFPWLRVIDNVEFGMKMIGIQKEERRERALKYIKMVHLTKFQNSFIHELSGGMKQRVALARALAMDSDLLLMDEPFAALDCQTKNLLQMELQRIWWETKKTIIFVTHNVEEAAFLSDRVVVMAANPGRFKKVINVDIARPREIESLDLTYIVSKIMKELKEEVEKVVRNEYDNDWNIQKDTILPVTDNILGIGL